MTDRLNKIFSVLPECTVFADIGCDHGYIAKAMLESGRCERAIIADISAKCLKKAEALLSDYIESGRVVSVVSNGFERLEKCDCALIAGMGGREIISILRAAAVLPERLVLQPMKNVKEVRECALSLGYAFVSDRVFFSDKKYYNLISLKKGEDYLTDEELKFGRNNINEQNPEFKKMIACEIQALKGFAAGDKVSDGVRREMHLKIKELEKYV